MVPTACEWAVLGNRRWDFGGHNETMVGNARAEYIPMGGGRVMEQTRDKHIMPLEALLLLRGVRIRPTGSAIDKSRARAGLRDELSGSCKVVRVRGTCHLWEATSIGPRRSSDL